MTQKLTDSLVEQKNLTQPDVPEITGLLGIPLGGQRRVEVSNRNAYVYVRLRNNQNEVIEAFNNQVAPAYNLPVKVARQGNRYIVLGVDTQRYENNWNSFAPFLPRHGNTHSFDIESGGGGDIVWVYPRQFIPSLVMPSGSLGAGNVFVNAYTLKKNDNTWLYVGNTGTPSLLTYRPTSPTGAVIALVYLDATTGNPKLIINSGTIFSNSITGSSQIALYIPSITDPNTQIPLAAVRLITGTNAISWDNIYDVRQFLHTIPTGTSGGSVNPPVTGSIVIQDEGIVQGSATALNFVGTNVQATLAGGVARIFVTGSSGGSIDTGTLDARYLKLDASNDPLTGRLDINVSNTNYALKMYSTGSSGVIYGVMDGEGIGAYLATSRIGVSVDQVGLGNNIADAPISIFRYEKNFAYLGSVFATPAYVVYDYQTGSSYYGSTLQHNYGSNLLLDINPNATGTSVPYIFNTNYSKPTGTILQSWRVQGIEKSYVDVSGTFYSNGSPLIKEASSNGNYYARKNSGWENIDSTLHGHHYIPLELSVTFVPIPASASPAFIADVSVDGTHTWTFVQWSQAWYVATTNNGSNYWTVGIYRTSDDATITTFNTSAGSANTWTLNTTTTFTIGSVSASAVGIYVKVTKTGTPGDFYLDGPLVEVSI